MSNLTDTIIACAERTFDRHGFANTGIDRLTAAADVSSRTMYKHVKNKKGLILAVLEERQKRFFDQFDVQTVDALFENLERWTSIEGARGCLFLRAQGELGDEDNDVASSVGAYRKKLYERVETVCTNELGQRASEQLTEQILILFEGSVSAASYRGEGTIRNARSAAQVLMREARSHL